MPRISMKLFASALGSLALISAVACEQRSETPQSDPATTTTTPAQEPNALRPSPSTSTPGAGGTSSITSVPSTAPTDEMDTQPVRGVDSETQGSGAGGTAGAGGHGGTAGQAGRTGH